MSKPPAARKTATQLMSMVWPDRVSAERQLKASRVPASTDAYELAEYQPGSWQLIAREAAGPPMSTEAIGAAVAAELAGQEMGPFPVGALADGDKVREQSVIDNLKRKRGAKPRGAPEVIADARKGRAQPSRRPNGKHEPGRIVPAKPAPAVIAEAPRMKETVTLFPDEGDDPAPPGPAVPNLLSPLPKEGGPYELVIAEGSGDAYPRHSTHTTALDLARRLKTTILVRDSAGTIVRAYEPGEVARLTRPARTPGGPVRGAKAGGRPSTGGEGKFPRAIALLSREQGATAKELERACGWENVTQRYVNRASRISGLGRIDHLGDKHWKISKSGK